MSHLQTEQKEGLVYELEFIPEPGAVFSALIPLLAAAPLAMAQSSKPEPSTAGQTSVSDKDLKSFAKAYVEYHKIRQSYETQLNKAQDAKEKEKIQQEGNAKVSKALQKEGLTPESYNKIFSTVNNNEQLRRKALKFIDEERKKS